MALTSLLLALLATAAVHSVALCAVALAVARFVRDPGRRSLLHRYAAVGALGTAVVAMALGAWTLIGESEGAAASAVEPVTGAVAPAGAAVDGAARASGGAPTIARTVEDAGIRLAWPPTPAAPWVLGVWAAVAALWIGRDGLQRRRFVRGLGRVPLDQVSPGGAALSVSDRLESPVVLSGVEVCVPRALWGGSADAERAAILAHEDAHIARRDPAWRAALRTVRALLWFQPLLRPVIAREAEAAELDCDVRALDRGAEPLALARVLARLAERGLARPAPFPAMARRHALVVERVARLTSGGGARRARGGVLFGAGLGCALALFACTAPRVDAPESGDDRAPAPDDAIVIEIDRDGDAELFGPGEAVPRAEVELLRASGATALGDALAALVAEPDFPFERGHPEGAFRDSFFIPRLCANPVHIRLEPDVPFSFAQQAMAQAARSGCSLWNIVVEADAVAYELPIPVDGAPASGVEVRIASEAEERGGRYGITARRAILGAEEEEERAEGESGPARALRWTDLAGVEAALRTAASAGDAAVLVRPHAASTFADVAPVLEAIERAGDLQVVLQGSTRR